jgi:hypothetical protein
MSKIQNIESTPNYISNFLKANMKQLCNIHDEGKQEHGIGCLGLKCSGNENTMDVFYMNEKTLIQSLKQESWEQLKTTIGEKRLFLINDLDLNSIFLIYI